MNCSIFMKDFEMHITPLETLVMRGSSIIVELDDINEKRHKIVFKPFQAVRITTIDCVKGVEYSNEYSFRDGIYHRHILMIDDSEWIRILKQDLTDSRATFLNKAKHYVQPLQDCFIEVVASDLRLSEV